MLSTDDKLAEIRRLYFSTTKQTIQDDLAKALDLLKSMHTEEERERATVYMEGLAQMRSDWATTEQETRKVVRASRLAACPCRVATLRRGARHGATRERYDPCEAHRHRDRSGETSD